jgi:hypothetical protein
MKHYFTIFTLVILWPVFALAGIIEVPGNQSTIQAGINAALNGDTVLVADSTYYENINFRGKAITVASHLLIDGDITHIDSTIIDGSQPSHPDSGSVVYFVSGEDTNSVLCGFTIAGGTGTYVPPNPPSLPVPFRLGGGIFCSQSGAYIKNNHIIENECIIDLPNAHASGGGISVDPPGYNSFVIIEINKIMNNLVWAQGTATTYYDAWAQGGGMALFTNGLVIKNEVLSNQCKSNNSVSVGGGIRLMGGTVDITDNNIDGNSAVSIVGTGFAGGISCSGANTIIDSNRITNNFIAGASECYGAAIYFDLNNNANWAIVNKNLISGNYSTSGKSCGGAIGIYRGDPEIYNNIVVENSAHLGGAFGVLDNCQPRLINNTIVNNQASLLGGGLYNRNSQSLVLNSILWGNTASQDSQVHVFSGSVILKYSDVEGGWPGEGNIDADPQFVAGDSLFHLPQDPFNPCVNSGADSIQIGGQWCFCPPDDYEGDERPYMGSMPDMGADETQIPPVGIEPQPITGIPQTYELLHNYPNPFNPTTTIEFALPHSGFVALKIYNILGEEVATLVSEKLQAGKYKYDWDASGMASGLYVYRLEVNGKMYQKKLILLK